MTKNNIIETLKDIYHQICANKLNDAISNLRPIVKEVENWDLSEALTQCETSIHYMIEYFSKGIKDPQQEIIYNDIKDRLYSLLDKISYNVNIESSSHLYYSSARFLAKKQLNLEAEFGRYSILRSEIELTRAAGGNIDIIKIEQLETIEKDIFNYIWTTLSLSASDYNILNSKLREIVLPDHFKVLIISSLFLGLLEYFDKQKFLLLIDLYIGIERSITPILMICLILSIAKYDERIKTCLPINKGLSNLSSLPDFENRLMKTTLQIINAQDTVRISRKVHEDLMPKLMKIYPDLMSKLKRTSMSFDPTDFESNPNWDKLVNDNTFINKIDELNKIQSEGGDVFISSFSHLKSFGFFGSVSNWFLPFHNQSSTILKNLGENQKESILSKISFLCNSDKYSFILSLGSIPQSQKEMLLSQLAQQESDLNEIKETQLPSSSDDSEDSIASRYLKDLYRFFNLYPHKSEFYNPFSLNIDYSNLECFRNILHKSNNISVIGEFYFKREMYKDAVKCLEESSSSCLDDTKPVVYQKIGFCYQHLNAIDEAISAYKRYELFNENDLWTIKHLASCYRLIGKIEKSIHYYQKAIEIAPENVSLNINLGNILLEKGDIEKAIQYYYKADYLESGSHRAWSPLAWCLFLQNDYDKSENYYQKLIETKPTRQDYINYGHLLFITGRIDKAINMYLNSISHFSGNLDSFEKDMNSDSKYLLLKNKTHIDIILMIDAVKLKFQSLKGV